jgi:HEAT repeat protein
MSRSLLLLVSFTLIVIGLSPGSARQKDDGDPVHGGKRASEWVKTLIEDPSARQRALAVDALAKLWADKQYEDSLPKISRSLRLDSSTAVRVQAAIALAGLNERDVKRVGKDLIEALGTEKESRVKKEIAVGLGRHPFLAKAGVANLTAALKDPEPTTLVAVADALAQAGADAKSAAANLAPLLAHEDKAVRRAAVIALGRTSPAGAPAIAETMSNMLATEKDIDMRVELVASLGLLGEKSGVVVAALAGLLTDPEDELRRRAARTLGTFGAAAAPAADTLLKTAAGDKLKDVRVDAVRAFGSALGPGLRGRVKDLLALLADREYEVRLAVVEEVGALGNDLKDDAETLRVIRSRLSDPHVKVREAAAVAIKKLEKKQDPKDPKKDLDPKKGD